MTFLIAIGILIRNVFLVLQWIIKSTHVQDVSINFEDDIVVHNILELGFVSWSIEWIQNGSTVLRRWCSVCVPESVEKNITSPLTILKK